MTTSANNICAGPGHIFLAPVGTTLPTASDVASLLAGTLTDWTSLGETKTGITQVVTESYLDIRTQQRTHQVAKVKTGQKTEFKTQLLEISASAIAAMSNGTVATASDADTVPAPAPTSAPARTWDPAPVPISDAAPVPTTDGAPVPTSDAL